MMCECAVVNGGIRNSTLSRRKVLLSYPKTMAVLGPVCRFTYGRNRRAAPTAVQELSEALLDDFVIHTSQKHLLPLKMSSPKMSCS